MMRWKMLGCALCSLCVLPFNNAHARSKSEECATYARQATRSTPTTTGAARGAARGAVVGSVVGGNAGTGAAVGTAVGATRRAGQKGRSYQSYYNECSAALGLLTAFVLMMAYMPSAQATPVAIEAANASIFDEFSAIRRGGGGRVHAGGHGRPAFAHRPGGRPGVHRPINRPGFAHRPGGRPGYVHRPGGRPGYVHRPGRGHVFVNRPIRGWAYRPYFGTVVGGIALGSVIAATTAGVAPAAPGPNMCWYWTDSARVRGYWDYCQTPY